MRGDFGDVVQELDARINGFTGSTSFPTLERDGVVLWPRYADKFHLYFAYLLRKDGRVAITKKCPGHVPGGSFYNSGSYFDLTSERYVGPTVVGRWYRLASSVQDNPDGSVTVRTFQDGRLVAQATDRGLGCAPIRGPVTWASAPTTSTPTSLITGCPSSRHCCRPAVRAVSWVPSAGQSWPTRAGGEQSARAARRCCAGQPVGRPAGARPLRPGPSRSAAPRPPERARARPAPSPRPGATREPADATSARP